jgi:hypothetical protein
MPLATPKPAPVLSVWQVKPVSSCRMVQPASFAIVIDAPPMDATDLSRPAEWWAWQFHQYVEIDQRRSGQLSLLEAE